MFYLNCLSRELFLFLCPNPGGETSFKAESCKSHIAKCWICNSRFNSAGSPKERGQSAKYRALEMCKSVLGLIKIPASWCSLSGCLWRNLLLRCDYKVWGWIWSFNSTIVALSAPVLHYHSTTKCGVFLDSFIFSVLRRKEEANTPWHQWRDWFIC